METWADIGYKTVMTTSSSSIIFDAEEAYKFLIIENKSLDKAKSSKYNNSAKKIQAQNLLKKLKICDISCVSTDLDQTT